MNLSEAAKSAAHEAMEREGSWDDVLRGLHAAAPHIAAQALRDGADYLRLLIDQGTFDQFGEMHEAATQLRKRAEQLESGK